MASPSPVGTLIDPCDKLLFRQIHPLKMKAGQPGVSNFVPENKVNLSTRRQEITAQGAHEAHVAIPLQSAGTWAITSQEAHDVAELPAYDDENLGGNGPFHVSVWFPSNITRGARERIARGLHERAVKRGRGGWLYGPV
ncbi:hypothetical protein [uncultured Williamsia sp.]|uniref:hypothetical protein n=1 Tax=uncultured Williamsia sp. TaxID=259311 RepID=UPI0026394F02|nr:hypothetical protein [uncultured Williamsia sp.]